ncbi:Hemicentin-1 [Orchesella cincta]|uniref:Hemicentin-1 n=1 Tax=Orchesella cincta TaxID=48709 RepID=A0A1D2N8X3_ORCCI|nr:Hemicentin-1 [Orchesella cincta]
MLFFNSNHTVSAGDFTSSLHLITISPASLQKTLNIVHTQNLTSCPQQDPLKIPFVTVVDSDVSQEGNNINFNSSLDSSPQAPQAVISSLVLVCIGHSPIEWNFDKFPINEKWNASYIRIAKNIRDASSFSFESRLTFINVSVRAFSEYRPTCQQVSNPACNRCTVLINFSPANSNVNFEFDTTARAIEDLTSSDKCNTSINLSFDSSLQLFYCQRKSSHNDSTFNSSISNTLHLRMCSNPTECGSSQDLNLCQEVNPSPTEKCINGTNGCSVFQMDAMETPTHIIGLDTTKYGICMILLDFKWEDADTDDLLYLETSRLRIISQESFDISCTMSYYYFAKGSHLTLKDLSNPLHLEVDLRTLKNVSILETVEVIENTEDDSDKTLLPVKRTTIVRGLTLPSAGDYEITCYGPVWNSFHWIAKSSLISVTESILPSFVNGNLTVNLKFHPLLNISCIANARPAPKLSWIFENDLFGMSTIDLYGSDEMVTWSFLTLPKSTEASRHVIKCRAENLVGYVEKVFVIERDDESNGLHTKIAMAIMLLGFIVNLIVLYFCWKHLFSEEDATIPKFFRMLRKGKKGSMEKANCKKSDGRVDTNGCCCVDDALPCSSNSKTSSPPC